MIHLIPAKYAATNQLLSSRPNEDFRMAVSYTPWLRALVSDIWLGSVYASKIVTSNSVVSGSFRYLSLGNIVFIANKPYYLANTLARKRVPHSCDTPLSDYVHPIRGLYVI